MVPEVFDGGVPTGGGEVRVGTFEGGVEGRTQYERTLVVEESP